MIVISKFFISKFGALKDQTFVRIEIRSLDNSFLYSL